MISTVIYTEKQEETRQIRDVVRDLAAHLTEEQWNFHLFENLREMDAYVALAPLIDLGCCRIETEQTIQWLEDFRQKYRDAALMLIADVKISPMKYLKPGIRASSLLQSPYSRQQLEQVLEEFIGAWAEEQHKEEETLLISDREGRTAIPYSQIYYIEARNKKIYIRTLHEEYGYYDTLDKLSEMLPEYFMRTHRSYIVNRKKITRVKLSGNVVELRDGIEVPLSRSFKSDFKGYGKNNG